MRVDSLEPPASTNESVLNIASRRQTGEGYDLMTRFFQSPCLCILLNKVKKNLRCTNWYHHCFTYGLCMDLRERLGEVLMLLTACLCQTNNQRDQVQIHTWRHGNMFVQSEF